MASASPRSLAALVSEHSDSFCIWAARTPYPSPMSITAHRLSLLAGLVEGVDGEVFNVVDDDLPSSREFLRSYKENVKAVQLGLCPPAFKLCPLLPVGEVLELFGRTVALGLQP